MPNSINALSVLARQQNEVKRAWQILETTQVSAASFLKTYNTVRSPPGSGLKKVTSTTDEQQDILRAMLVLTTAGLDSCLKQLIRESLIKLAEIDSDVKTKIEKYCLKQLGGLAESDKSASAFLSRVLFSASTKGALIEEYIRFLTGSSLQSADELLKVADALNIKNAIPIDTSLFKCIFTARNNIVHELDIDFTKARRIRTQRKQDEMLKYVNAIIAIGEKIVNVVNEKLAAC